MGEVVPIWQVVNVKLSVKAPAKSLKDWEIRLKEQFPKVSVRHFGNFIQAYIEDTSLRLSVFASIKSHQTLNITGARTKIETIEFERRLNQCFPDLHQGVWKRKICLTVQARLSQGPLILHHFRDKAVHLGWTARLDFEHFPGLCLTIPPQNVTCILYQSGKVIIFGLRNHQQCVKTIQRLLELWPKIS